MTMWSGGGSRASSASIAGRKSSATVQQRQPLASSTISSSGQASTPQLRKNLAVDADVAELVDDQREAPALASAQTRWRISVVLPAPRKPVTMVAGILPLMLASQFWRAGQRRARGAESGTAWGTAKSEIKIMVVSLPPRRRRLMGFRRQVSWLAGQRLAPPSRGFRPQWHLARPRRSQLRGQPRDRKAPHRVPFSLLAKNRLRSFRPAVPVRQTTKRRALHASMTQSHHLDDRRRDHHDEQHGKEEHDHRHGELRRQAPPPSSPPRSCADRGIPAQTCARRGRAACRIFPPGPAGHEVASRLRARCACRNSHRPRDGPRGRTVRPW